jgi:plastocyanin
MKRLLALILLGMLVFGCAQAPSSTAKNDNQPVPNKVVAIKDFTFNPADTTINKGMTVLWVNEDSVPHTVAFGDGSQSPILVPGQNYSRTFADSGDFAYSCGIHPSMKGSIKVLGASD